MDFNEIVFGSKVLLRQLSFLSNDEENNQKSIKKVKEEYQNRRVLPITIGGETLLFNKENT